ncbi:polysaccharide deacetylase family protein [Proteiniborus sp.]|uniref:polysaccharide deacetylase family protein n=1 Tax=Proteiniborus sp. TaxID=2079015 RepID=UPI0033219F75
MIKNRTKLNIILDVIFFALIVIIILQNKTNTVFLNTADDLAKASNIVQNGPRDKKALALTFDDGPHPIYTKKILDILKEYDVKATFFILGKHGELYPDLLYRQKQEGHEIGIHSYNHINMRKEKEEIVKDEFNSTQQIIYKTTGEKARSFRPPYGTYNQTVYDIAVANQCKIVLWTYYQDPKDWSNPGVDKIVETVLSQATNGDIVLFHDHNEAKENQTIEALEEILPELIKRGFKFVTVSELLSYE